MDLEGFETAGPTLKSSKKASTSSDAVVALEEIENNFYMPACRSARWMDLLGDYGGKSLFVIEGESLLQNVLNNTSLALGRPAAPPKPIDTSFQLGHAKFLLENALKEFTSRDANFDVVFFESLAHATILDGSDSFVTASRALARKLLFQHLQTISSLRCHIFTSDMDTQWKEYVTLNQPMFIMLNDGGDLENTLHPRAAEHILTQRAFMLRVAASGMAFTLLQGAEYVDSKISTFVFEAQGLAQRTILSKTVDGALAQAQAAVNNATSYPMPLLHSSAPESLPSLPSDLDPVLAELFTQHLERLPLLPIRLLARKRVSLHSTLESLLYDDFLPRVFKTMAASDQPSRSVDGRLFLEMIAFTVQTQKLPNSSGSNLDIAAFAKRYPLPSTPRESPGSAAKHSLLPFENSVFSTALQGVDSSSSTLPDETPQKESIFGRDIVIQDLTHWHNTRSILPSYLGGQRSKPATEWEKRKRDKREQRDQARLQKQAASLTGAAGGVLHRQIIPPAGKGAKVTTPVPERPEKRPAKTQKVEKAKPLSGADKLRAKIQADKAAKGDGAEVKWWKEKLAAMQLKTVDRQMEELSAMTSAKAAHPIVAIEIRLYRIHLLLKRWIGLSDSEAQEKRDTIVVDILRQITSLSQMSSSKLSKTAHTFLTTICQIIGFEKFTPTLVPQDRDVEATMTFDPIKLTKKGAPLYPFMRITTDPIMWQLTHYGEFMDRSMDSAPDRRVAFHPDKWQRDVLDAIDAQKSILTLAPTSAGKTFISFYAMEQVLRESDDGILVYVAPTKALVNQIAAEVYARFSKTYRGSGTLLAVQTRDTRIGDIQRAQILVTVPEMLGILIMSPTLARNWTARMKRIILDEIHSIGEDEGGAVWETILLLAPCPIIGLSATVGSPESFNTWLQDVQTTHNFMHTFVHHPHRYSHLRKYLYLPSPEIVEITGLHQHKSSADQMAFLHPVSLLAENSNSLPVDLALESNDCVALYDALKKLKLVEGEALGPVTFFSKRESLLKQADILSYEASLKEVVNSSLKSGRVTPQELASTLHGGSFDLSIANASPSRDQFLGSLTTMLADLNSQQKLPAILFNFDRTNCEVMAKTIVRTLEEAENEWKETSAEWQAKLRRVDEYQKAEPLRRKVQERESKQRKDADAPRDEKALPWEATFDETEPLENFSFAGRPPSKEELQETIREMESRWVGVAPWAISALRRGIAVHHAGMPKMYRVNIEMLFRQGFIRIMISTGTLALGINAPARTAVFCGDSPFLTALMYRQCAGRAGRRGFDLLGHVVFYGMNIRRVQRLVLSELPSLGYSFPLTSTLILRLFNLLAGSGNSEYAQSAITRLLSIPRISHRSDIGREQVLHHVRFSIDYLRYCGLLTKEGKPSNLFSLASHLYYTEPSNFALIHLFEDGIIHRICNGPSALEAEDQVLLILCHLFGRKYISSTYRRASVMSELRKKYPSMIVLPNLPANIGAALRKHDNHIRDIFVSSARSYAASEKEALGEDDRHPLSGVVKTAPSMPDAFQQHLEKTKLDSTVRSVFAASSGLDDAFTNVSDLVTNVRSGIHLYGHAIPSMEAIIASSDLAGVTPPEHPLNAYIYDFYNHGQLSTLSVANGIRRGDVWYLLQSFELVLKAVRAALQEILLQLSAARRGDTELESTSDNEDDEEGVAEGMGISSAFKRPQGTKEKDWKVYTVFETVLLNFEEKYRKIFA